MVAEASVAAIAAVVADKRAAEATEDTLFAAAAKVSVHTSMAAAATLEMAVDLALIGPNQIVMVVEIALMPPSSSLARNTTVQLP